MPTKIPITLYEGNTSIIIVTCTPDIPTDDLTLVTSAEVFIKSEECLSDIDTSVVKYTSPSAEVTITSAAPAQLVVTLKIPPAVITPPYRRFWRLDLLSGPDRRTAAYGHLSVIDL